MELRTSRASTTAVKVGPWGGPCGTPRDMNMRVESDGLVSITLRSGGGGYLFPSRYIHSFSFVYVNPTGQSISVGPWGSSEYGTEETITLGQNEHLVEVWGMHDMGGITSLVFVTCTGTRYGPYGSPRGLRFGLSLVNSHVIGFFGRAAEHLIALGLYLAPIPDDQR